MMVVDDMVMASRMVLVYCRLSYFRLLYVQQSFPSKPLG
jgi:hypothetical protein